MNPLTVLRDAFHFFSRHLPSIAPLCLPLIAAECLARAVVAGLVDTDHSPAYELLVGLFFYPLYSAALILFLDARSQGQRPSTRNLLAAALPLWPSFAVLAGLSTLLIMLGGALFLPVALYLMVKLAFSEYLLVLRGLAPLPAMRESFLLTRGYFWQLGPLLLGIILPLWLLHGWLGSLLPSPSSPLAVLLDSGHALAQLFTSVLAWRLCQLRLQLTEAA